MKNIYKPFLVVYIFTIIIACSNNITESDPIVFDYYKSYPETDIKLSDIAEVKYIPMKGGEQNYILPGNMMWGGLYVDEAAGKMYISQARKIYVYDMNGNPVRVLDKEGRGPEEYLSIIRFWIEKENNEVYCYSIKGQSFVIYDTLFNFKRRISLTTPALQDIVRINGDTLAVYNHVAEFDTKSRHPDYPSFFFTMSRSTVKVIKPIKYHIERPVRDISAGPEFLSYPSVIRGMNGVFMTNKCCDTVLWMDNTTLAVTPRFIDITDYRTPECMTIPSFETDNYLFFDTHFVPRLSPDIQKRYFLYDKKNKKIFRIRARVYEPLENLLGIVNNQCALTSNITTQNSNYGAVFIQPLFLLENLDDLPDELRTLASTLNENDNPVLMLIKLKK